MGLLLSVNALYALWYWNDFISLRSNIPYGSTFNLARAKWFTPFLAYFVFGISLQRVFSMLGRYRSAVYILLLVQILYLLNVNFRNPYFSRVSFDSFFSPKIFNDIKQHLPEDLDSFKVVGLGLLPSIPQYSGLNTIDFYLGYYQKQLKEKFRPAIRDELARNENLRRSFDNWGNRLFLFSDEISKIVGKSYKVERLIKYDLTLSDLRIDFTYLKSLGVDYLFSSLPIDTESEPRLTMLGKFTDVSTPRVIFVYEITN